MPVPATRRLTRSSVADVAPAKAAQESAPVVDGALTRQSRTPAVPPARSASASSMQSPPASAEATSVIILSPVLARPGASPRSRRCCTSLGKTEVQGQGGWEEQAGIVHQAGDRRRRLGCGRGGCVVASIGCSFSGVGLPLQNHYPRFRGAPSCRFRTADPDPLLRWIRDKVKSSAYRLFPSVDQLPTDDS